MPVRKIFFFYNENPNRGQKASALKRIYGGGLGDVYSMDSGFIADEQRGIPSGSREDQKRENPSTPSS